MKILIINGPNLNMLGKRQPEIYGSETFEDILAAIRTKYSDMDIHYFQSNSEGVLIDRIQEAFHDSELKGMVVNLGAYTHYSYGLQDALGMLSIPIIEVHISHIFAREKFRHTSVISPVCKAMISGMGTKGYFLAVEGLREE